VFNKAESTELAFLRLASRYKMNDLTDKNDQAFLDACGALGLEPGAMVESLKERFVVTDFLFDPLVWLETELPYEGVPALDFSRASEKSGSLVSETEQTPESKEERHLKGCTGRVDRPASRGSPHETTTFQHHAGSGW
jgi:hypothetical protein